MKSQLYGIKRFHKLGSSETKNSKNICKFFFAGTPRSMIPEYQSGKKFCFCWMLKLIDLQGYTIRCLHEGQQPYT